MVTACGVNESFPLLRKRVCGLLCGEPSVEFYCDAVLLRFSSQIQAFGDLSQAGADFPQDGVELEGEGAGAVAVAALPVEDGLLGKTN